MDMYVEKQCVENLRNGELSQFLLLLDAYFDDLYKYVVRRVGEGEHVEEIVRLTFLDALGQARNTPVEGSYVVWLYGLARPRVIDYIEREGMPSAQGIITNEEKIEDFNGGREIFEKAETLFGKMSLEEREILRLKFFEEVADGDVMSVLDVSEELIGAKIYRVLKRVHFLLFGETEGNQGVYFGELSGLLARMRGLESIQVPEHLKLDLRVDISGRIERRDFAFEAEAVAEKKESRPAQKGSDDPAKIFVEAVKELKEDEENERIRQEEKDEKWERIFELVEKWRFAFVALPVVIMVGIFSYAIFNFVTLERDSKPIERGYPTVCEVDVLFDGDFWDGELRGLNSGVSDRICEYFEVKSLNISKIKEGQVDVVVDVSGWMLEYGFVRKNQDWRIKKYARHPYSNEKSG